MITNPKARSEQLITEEIGDEIVIYDLTSGRVHSLSEFGTAIWKRCDGSTSVSSLVDLIVHDFQIAKRGEAEKIVTWTLSRLQRAHLLEDASTTSTIVTRPGFSRRDLGRIAAAALAVPIITSIVAPSLAEAASCAGTCAGTRGDQCSNECGLPCCGSTSASPRTCCPSSADNWPDSAVCNCSNGSTCIKGKECVKPGGLLPSRGRGRTR